MSKRTGIYGRIPSPPGRKIRGIFNYGHNVEKYGHNVEFYGHNVELYGHNVEFVLVTD